MEREQISCILQVQFNETANERVVGLGHGLSLLRTGEFLLEALLGNCCCLNCAPRLRGLINLLEVAQDPALMLPSFQRRYQDKNSQMNWLCFG